MRGDGVDGGVLARVEATMSTATADPTTLQQAARFLDEYYCYLAAVAPSDHSEAHTQNVGMRAVTAELAALLRQWARTGEMPETRRAAMKVRRR